MFFGFVIVIKQGIPQFDFRCWYNLSQDVLVDSQKEDNAWLHIADGGEFKVERKSASICVITLVLIVKNISSSLISET